MCGIAGIYGSLAPDKKERALQQLTHELAHRGPDGCKRYEDGDVGLVHTRLSIIDLSVHGDQPMYNEDKTLVLVCNGEIYNYQALRQELIGKGHVLSSTSDCEVILHLYEEHREDPSKLLGRLTGMFAFALWDINMKRLFIARDRVGIKPLYYHHDGKHFIFSSEVKPIAEAGIFEPRTDHTSLYEYFLLGSIPGPNTLFEQVKCLEPGHYLTLQEGKMQISEYWDIPRKLKKWTSEQEVTNAVEQLLIPIVKDHLVADVPVGTFLSAGVDSSLITAIAVGHHPGIHSFTAAFPGEPEDEGVIAAQTAVKLGTTHHTYEITSGFFEDFSRQFRDIDQPFAIASALSLGRISALAKKEVKVVLSGDGGDELFGGYNRHSASQVPGFVHYIPRTMRDNVLKLGAKLTRKESLEKLRQNLKITEAQRFFDKVITSTPQSAISFFTPDVVNHIDRNRFLNRIDSLFKKAKTGDKLNDVLYVDMKTTLVDEMLTKCDRMTMINGIEGRVPFLDHRLVELAFGIPEQYKRQEHVGKLPLRNILAKHLGRELAFREKTGFNSPLKQWLQRDETTTGFARANMEEAKKILFLNQNKLSEYAGKANSVSPVEVFELVCINTFYKNAMTGKQ